MHGITMVTRDGLRWLCISVLMLLFVLVLPAAAILTRTLLPITAAVVVVALLATFVSPRFRHWVET